MATREELYPSKWLKHSDIPAEGLTVTVTRLDLEMIGDEAEAKPVLSFREVKKGLVLNQVNFDTVAEWHGPNTDSWIGKRIKLYSTKVKFGKKLVDGLRVVPKQQPIPAPPEEDLAADKEALFPVN